MKPLPGRGFRRLVLGLTVAVALAVVGLLLSLTQVVRADIASLDGSTKSVSSDMVSPGSVITYTIVVSNDAASPVSSVLVTDALPDEVSYVPLSAHSVPEGAGVPSFDIPNYRHITFTVATIPANSEISLVFRALVGSDIDPDTVFTNTALISGSVVTLSRSVAATVVAPPSIAIKTPWDNQLITTRDQFVVTGRAWTDDQTPGFPGVPALHTTPSPIPAGQNFYFVQWDPVDGALAYVLQESNDPHFAQLTSYDGDPATSPVYFSGKAAGTYYYRVLARNAYEGFWSAPISVTVTSAAMAAEASAEPASSQVALYQPVIKVNIKPAADGPGNWVSATSVTLNPGGWWDWTYNWTPPQANDVQYVIQARAEDQAGNVDPTATDTVTVTMHNGTKYIYMPIIMKRWPPVPYAPTLALSSNDGAGNYTLSWTYGHALYPPTNYRFQEATDSSFNNLLINEIRFSPQTFTAKNTGTYYYRVAGINSYGQGEWSNVIPVTVVRGFFDDFSNAGSGWPRKVYKWNDKNVFDVNYENGSYRAKILVATAANGYVTNRTMGTVGAPWDNPYNAYDVEVRHYFTRAGDQGVDPTAGKAGLIFGANADYTTFYVIEWNFEGNCSVNRYLSRTSPVSRSDIDREIFRDWGRCSSVKTGYDQVNTARVTVNGGSATVYINGTEIVSFSDSDLGSRHEVGILSGAWDRTPVEGRFDNFRVTPR